MIATVLRTALIYLLLAVILRLSGKRQVGELEISELVCTLLLSELAAIPISDHDIPILFAILPILLILCLEIVFTYLKNKSLLLKALLEDPPTYLIKDGVLCQKALLNMRISIEEFQRECRLQGCPDISMIRYAILEDGGKMSIFLKAPYQPLTVQDSGKKPQQDSGIARSLIVDGKIRKKTAQALSYSRSDLEKLCARYHSSIADTFLLTVDDSGAVKHIPKQGDVL